MTRRHARIIQPLGVFALVAWLAWFHATRLAPDAYAPFGTERVWWSLALIGLLQVTSYGFGLPDLINSRRTAVLAGIGAVGASVLGISLLQLLLGQALLPRSVVFGSAVLLVPWYVVCAGFTRDFEARAAARDSVVVVGTWADAASLSAELETGAERPARVVDSLTPQDAAATAGGRLPLVELVRSTEATVVVLDRVAQIEPTVVLQAATLHEQGVRIRSLSLFSEEWLGKLPLSELERVSLMFDIGEIHRLRYGRVKRVLDVALALVGMLALAIVTPVVLVGNLVANRGPLFFRQVRVGKADARITIIKFRTMSGAASGAGTWTGDSDQRVTPFGRLLRRSHLDELPQMWNILRGDLSIVGPRPEQVHYVEELTEKLPFYRLRHLVRPGLTGWAQVKYGYAASESDALEKLQYEFYYLRHQRLALDLRIVGRTLRSVLGREGT
jgi:lipopolysaccharide/colanic/teichoic acid biosynthesis glycosyltransferase